jgi:hypothetical protein
VIVERTSVSRGTIYNALQIGGGMPLMLYEAETLVPSVAMLRPDQMALDREKALAIVDQLRQLLEAEDRQSRAS